MARHCTSCRHFTFSQGEHGYYPGEGHDSSMTCDWGVWEIDNETETQETLHGKLAMAKDCGSYAVADFAQGGM